MTTEDNSISLMSTSPTSFALSSRSTTAVDDGWKATRIPFQRCNQLCKDLDYTHDPKKSPVLHNDQETRQTLPDAPRVSLNSTSRLIEYCLDDIDTPHLNRLGEKLWWAGPTPNIASLTQQTVLERRIQVTEDPSVHLLWTDGIIYIKPLPAYLTSYAFWEYVLDPSNTAINTDQREQLCATSLGFLRTYAHLIHHRSDFTLALRNDLLASFPGLSFETFTAFIAAFDNIPDKDVSERWRYGLLNLDALNLHSAIHLHRWHLNRFESRYGAYFSRFFPVVLFIFAFFSVVLSAMQVIVGAKQMGDTGDRGLNRTLGVFVWTSTEAIGWSIAFGGIFVVWWVGISGVEAVGRRKMRRRVQERLKRECEGDA